jgi:hypothetical protein
MKLIITTAFIVLSLSGFAQSQVKIVTHDAVYDTCHQWNINVDSLGVIFEHMVPLSGETHHCCYHNYFCTISGLLIYKGKKYAYDLNSGGWASLRSLDYKEQFLLACTDKR